MDKSRKNARKRAYRIELALKYTLFVFLLAVLLFPYLFMLLKSLMDIVDINAPVVRFSRRTSRWKTTRCSGSMRGTFSIRLSS